jgi:hypothetical protein
MHNEYFAIPFVLAEQNFNSIIYAYIYVLRAVSTDKWPITNSANMMMMMIIIIIIATIIIII